MNRTQEIRIADYDYPLPEERIARYPMEPRDASRLLVYRKGKLEHRIFRELPEFFEKGELMVFNNTRVILARLHFRKETGALIEVFCLEPYEPRDYQQSFKQRGECYWTCLVGNKKRWKEGRLSRNIMVGKNCVELSAETVGEAEQNSIVRFRWKGTECSFAEVLEAVGELPIPPYLNREAEEKDKTTYQTVYSKVEGSVAAPTAGLHFTQEVLDSLRGKGVETDEITLHVGAGTFRPVKTQEIGGHSMHSETIFVKKENLRKLLAHDGHCTAIGTTTVRTLESLYYMGLKVLQHPDLTEDELHIDQWMPYELPQKLQGVTTQEALETLLDYLCRRDEEEIRTSTQIIIAPGYKYHVVEKMVTNFHMPKSTLLLLVAAFVGEEWRNVYKAALDGGYRFLSYGDSSLLIPKTREDGRR